MSLWNRGKWYWADFAVNGLRYRVALRDSRGKKIPADELHREAAARAEERAIEKAEQGQLAPRKDRYSRLRFMQAAEVYLASRKLELAPSSLVKETILAARLKGYFKEMRLSTIKTENVIAYRQWRVEHGVGPALVNMEVGSLRRILKRAKLWHLVGVDIKPLKEPNSIGRALNLEERTRLFRIAAQRHEWETAYWAAIVAVSTTARGCELRALRWHNVDLINRTMEIPQSKTEAGLRVVPLTPEAYDAFLKLRRRAKTFGVVELSHFVFAASRSSFDNRKSADGGTPEKLEITGFDPSRPMGNWRAAWRSLTRAIECPKCKRLQRPAELCKNPNCKADLRGIKSPVAGLRFHDLRHTAISALGEAGVPDRVIMDIAGHVSPRMLRRYSHIQLEAKRKAIRALSIGSKRSS